MEIMVKKTLEVGDVVSLKGCYNKLGWDIGDGKFKVVATCKGDYSCLEYDNKRISNLNERDNLLILAENYKFVGLTNLEGFNNETLLAEIRNSFAADNNWWFIESVDEKIAENCGILPLREMELKEVIC